MFQKIPSQCWFHNLILDGQRSVNYNAVPGNFNCDTFDSDLIATDTRVDNYDWKGENWYRFAGDAGSTIPTSAPGLNKCGTASPGWMNGALPKDDYTTKDVQFCFQTSKGACDVYTKGQVTDCGSFYVYFLQPVASRCNLAYCGTVEY